MSKTTKCDKVLIRNPVAPVGSRTSTAKVKKPKKVHFTEFESQGEEIKNVNPLNGPEFLTVLKLADEVKEIRSAKCSAHTIPEGLKYKNLNFAPEERLFQNLIDLDIPDGHSTKSSKSQSSSSTSMFKKDKEPDYQHLLKYKLEKAYCFSSSIKITAKKPKPVFEGYSIYDKLKTWVT